MRQLQFLPLSSVNLKISKSPKGSYSFSISSSPDFPVSPSFWNIFHYFFFFFPQISDAFLRYLEFPVVVQWDVFSGYFVHKIDRNRNPQDAKQIEQVKLIAMVLWHMVTHSSAGNFCQAFMAAPCYLKSFLCSERSLYFGLALPEVEAWLISPFFPYRCRKQVCY